MAGDDRHMDTYIQITQLPTLQEFSHEEAEPLVEKVLAKAVALQLKPARAHITQFAFDRLLMLVDGQLNDMIAHLHRISNLQRRESIAKDDLQLLLQGFNLTPSALEQQCRASNYYRETFSEEFDHLHSLKEVNSPSAKDDVPFEDQEALKQNVASVLVPPTNPLQKILPSWLPSFPPDHTYKFTPQYSHPITDETVIRRKIVEEGKQSELALANLSIRTHTSQPLHDDDTYDDQLAQDETLAIYGRNKKRKTTPVSSAELISKLPQTNFSVEEYAHSRVQIARKKVLEFEERQWQAQQDPFLKLSRIALTPFNEKFTRRQGQKEFQLALKRSFLHLVKSIPKLEETKREVEATAREERDKRLAELRARREEQAQMGEKDVLDLDELAHNQEDFFAMESSEDEMEPVQAETAPQEQQHQQPGEQLENVRQEPIDERQGETSERFPSESNPDGNVEELLHVQPNGESNGKPDGESNGGSNEASNTALNEMPAPG